MDTLKYLRQYNFDEDRVLHWIRMNGGDPAIASMLIDNYAYVEKKFESGYELSHTLLEETLKDHTKSIKEILDKHKRYNVRPPFIDRIKLKVKLWLSTLGQ